MKNTLFICMLFITLVSQSQEIKLANTSKNTFLVGDKAEIITSIINQEFHKYLSTNRIKLILDGKEVNYVRTVVNDTILKWEFGIPSFNSIVGENKKLVFDDGTNISQFVYINIYSETPELIRSPTNRIFNDVVEPQNLTFFLNNVAYVDKIQFVDKRIQIEGTNSNSIKSNNNYFVTNTANNSLSINIIPNKCENFNIIFFYTNNVTYESTSCDTIELKINIERKYLHERFKIYPTTDLYIDDFKISKYKPKLIFDFDNLGTVGRRYTIEVANSNLSLRTLPGEQVFDMPPNKKVEMEVAYVKTSGIYEVKITGNAGETFFSNLNILPEPKISDFIISNSPNYEIEKDLNKVYSLTIKGESLQEMNDVQVELVNINSSQAFTLNKLPNIEENSISSQIKFNLIGDELKVGSYYLRLVREIKEKEFSFKRVYPINNPIISIIYPKKILPDQVKQVEFFEQENFRGINNNKKYSELKGRILTKNSPLNLKITPNWDIANYGPQYLNINIKYYKSNGQEVYLDITEKGNDYITVFEHPIFIDLKKEFDIKDFNVNEKIIVKVGHSPEMYGSNMLSPVYEKKYYRGSYFVDNIGITLTIPPYLATFRNVKRKSIIEKENGECVVTYDGEKQLEFQSLTINAGVGIKYRGKNKDYEPSKFALGLYLMGLDFANTNSSEEQKKDIKNYNFVARGSFNLLFLGEYSFLNLENPNTNIPVYLGFMYIPNPIDGGPNFAPVFGLGIDIKLFGSN